MKRLATVVAVVFLLAGLLATASVSRADVTESSRRAAVCTPTVWRTGCATPISLAGLVQLLDSYAATLPPLRFLASHYVAAADDCQTSLGSWAKVDGLDGYGEGVELSRAASAESQLVQQWLSELVGGVRQSDVTVTLVDSLGQPLETWRLTGVVPVSWSIVGFDAGAKVALETLDLGYQGLTPADPC